MLFQDKIRMQLYNYMKREQEVNAKNEVLLK